MRLRNLQILKHYLVILLLISPALSFCQKVVERGAAGKPAQVLDETEEWTVPMLLVSDKDVQIYMPDITSPDWLKRNYPDYHDRSFYTLSLFTFYKTPEACKISQTNWGLGDSQHLNDCTSTGYRVRQAIVSPNDKSATLLMTAMVDLQGVIVPSSILTDRIFRHWDELDENTQNALKKANTLIAEQMKIYDQKLQSTR